MKSQSGVVLLCGALRLFGSVPDALAIETGTGKGMRRFDGEMGGAMALNSIVKLGIRGAFYVGQLEHSAEGAGCWLTEEGDWECECAREPDIMGVFSNAVTLKLYVLPSLCSISRPA
jgi:hypothetical protein